MLHKMNNVIHSPLSQLSSYLYHDYMIGPFAVETAAAGVAEILVHSLLPSCKQKCIINGKPTAIAFKKLS